MVVEGNIEEEGCAVKGGWRKLHNERLGNLYWSRNITKAMKTGRIKWLGHAVEETPCGSS